MGKNDGGGMRRRARIRWRGTGETSIQILYLHVLMIVRVRSKHHVLNSVVQCPLLPPLNESL